MDWWGIDVEVLLFGVELVNEEFLVYFLEVVFVIVSFFLVVIVVMIIVMLYCVYLYNKNMVRVLLDVDSVNCLKSDFLVNMSYEICMLMNGVFGIL